MVLDETGGSKVVVLKLRLKQFRFGLHAPTRQTKVEVMHTHKYSKYLLIQLPKFVPSNCSLEPILGECLEKNCVLPCLSGELDYANELVHVKA